MEDLIKDRISDSLFLLSRDNYWDAIKIVYDILINETFLHGKNEKNHKQHELESQGKEILCLLYDFLKSEEVVNVADVISEIRLLTIYFNNFSREVLNSNVKNHKIKVLTMNLIGLLNFINKKKGGSKYYFGRIDTDLNTEIQNNLTEEIYKATNPYFELLLTSKETFEKNFWEDLSEFDPLEYPISVFSDQEYELLTEYKELIDTYQLEISLNIRSRINEIWLSLLQIDDITDKLLAQYHLMHLYGEFDEFRRADKSVGKYDKNTYTKEKETAFHKNIYPYLCGKGNYDLIFSEFSTGNHRFDISIYDANLSLSAIVELKVNSSLEKPSDSIQQLISYLNEIEDKPYHYILPPTMGVLLIYYIGTKKLSEIDFCKKADRYSTMVKITNNFYLLKPDEDIIRPILIGLYNGKE